MYASVTYNITAIRVIARGAKRENLWVVKVAIPIIYHFIILAENTERKKYQ
ncbi:hypothetical protein [Cylindrospermopsis curvispora]|uniref:Uncharacterized protein n=1 Tax=Cylindrospermopsis curvispora GIHE-G1 TaxID=2666332 RepID=A0A7H0EXM9_9CYAN|nr:hypothetical protein [Cylindrospermopsis curvispora]QNP28545.1 hypothetical protein IAR63_11565 [Cylindrospermopsis curvispora GIHE-G1]